MRSFSDKLSQLARHWPLLAGAAITLAALLLLRQSASAPIAIGSIGRIDSLSAFFMLATLGGLALSLAGGSTARFDKRLLAVVVALLVAYSAPNLLVIAGCYGLVALLGLPASRPKGPDGKETRSARRQTKDEGGKGRRSRPSPSVLRQLGLVPGVEGHQSQKDSIPSSAERVSRGVSGLVRPFDTAFGHCWRRLTWIIVFNKRQRKTPSPTIGRGGRG
jgi:hypothetical protein